MFQTIVTPYLLAAKVAYKELHLRVIKSLVDIEYIDGVASSQQLLHHVLPQKPRASNHCAFLSLDKERNGKRTRGMRTKVIRVRLNCHEPLQ